MNLTRLGQEYRGKNVGAALHYNKMQIRVRLTDIPYIQERGAIHLDNIIAARKGNQAAIKLLQNSERDNRYLIEADFDTFYDRFLISCSPSIELGYKVKITDEFFDSHDLWAKSFRDSEQFEIRAAWNKTSSFTEPLAELPAPPQLTPVDDYDLSFGTPRSFKDCVSDLIYVNYVAIAWQLFNRLKAEYKGAEPIPRDYKDALAFLFRYHNIKSILDVGFGNPPLFLKQLSPLAQKIGIKLYGIDLYACRSIEASENITYVNGDAAELAKYFKSENFDIIVSSGVLGTVQFMVENNRGFASRLSLFDARQQCLKIALGALAKLSANPVAAVYLQSFSSFFLLNKEELMANGVKVLYWNNEEMKNRKETNSSRLEEIINSYIYRATNRSIYTSPSNENRHFRQLWEQGANVAVLGRY